MGSTNPFHLLSGHRSYLLSISHQSGEPHCTIQNILRDEVKDDFTHCVAGFRRGVFVWDKAEDTGALILKSLEYMICADASVLRLGTPVQRFPACMRIPLDGHEMWLDFTWDEETRRACFLMSHTSDSRRDQALLTLNT